MQKLMMVLLLEWSTLLILSVSVSGQAEELYRAQCSVCHGMDGSGSTPAGKKKKLSVSDLRSPQVQNLSDEELFKTIAYGVKHKQNPHAFVSRGLTPKQIADLVAHIRNFSKHK
jgi:mono/diheme cytochrome c family protein